LIVNFVERAVFLRFISAPRRVPPVAVFSLSTFIAVFGFLLIFQTTGKNANNLYISIGYFLFCRVGTEGAIRIVNSFDSAS